MSYANSPVTTDQRRQLDVVLDQLARRIPGVVHAVAVSPDGLRLGATTSLADNRVDQLAAMVSGMVSGMVSLATGAATLLEAGPWSYHMLVMNEGILVVQAVADGTSLAALAHPDADPSMVAFELANLAAQIGGVIAPDPRPARLSG